MHKRNILRKLFLFRLWTFFTSPFPAEYLVRLKGFTLPLVTPIIGHRGYPIEPPWFVAFRAESRALPAIGQVVFALVAEPGRELLPRQSRTRGRTQPRTLSGRAMDFQ